MSEALRGRTALVTGATRGIGRAVAGRFAEAGASLFLLARGEEELRGMERDVGGTAVPADVRDAVGLWDALDGVVETAGGPPDVVVNAAGVFDIAAVAETTVEIFDRNVAVNLRGSFLVIRALLPAMLERGSGHLVSIGSVAGRRAFPGNGAYGASKWGLRGLHGSLLEELRGSGVTATLIEPAATDTSIWDPLDPDGRDDLPDRAGMLRPEDVAEAVLFAVTRPPGVRVPHLSIERG